MMTDLRLRALQPGDRVIVQRIRQRAFRPVFQSFRTILGPDIWAVALQRADEEQADLLDALMNPESDHDVRS